MSYKKEYHTLTCPQCGKDYQVQTPAYIRKTNGKSSMLCASCNGRRQRAINFSPDKIAEQRAKAKVTRAKNMTEEHRKELAEAQAERNRQYWANLSDEERQKISEKRSKDRRNFLNSLSDKRRKEINKNISNSKKAAFNAMTDEEKKAWSDNLHKGWNEWWLSLPEEERKERIQYVANASAEKYHSLSDEEKAAIAEFKSNVMKSYWENMSPEEYNRLMKLQSESQKKAWDNMSDEAKQAKSDMLRAEVAKFWSDPENHLRRSEKSKEYWGSLDEEEKARLLIPLYEGRAKRWANMSEEDRIKTVEHLSKISKEHWKGLSDDERDVYLNKMSEAQKKRIAAMTPEEFEKSIAPLMNGAFSRWYQSLSDEEHIKYANKMREKVNKFWADPASYVKQSNEKKAMWANMTPDKRREMLHKMHTPKAGGNSFSKRFEAQFDESFLSNMYYFKAEVVLDNGDYFHSWDYGIYDLDNNLVMVVDLDGAYYHADICDYDGIHSHEEYDSQRMMSIPPDSNIKTAIILELKFKESFELMMKSLILNYDEFMQMIFDNLRIMPFPYPHYQVKELMKSYNDLSRMNCNSNLHQDISLNTRLGDRLIQHFHRNIWHSSVGNNISPYDAWYDDKLLMECIENRTFYQYILNPNKILQGFNVSKIAPKVSVFSAGRAKLIISRYLSEFDTIFDPFSGFSGRMLGTIASGKKYIGQDINEITVRESNELISFLQEYYKFDVSVTQQDILTSTGEYPCLFTCPPYSDKEQWNGTPVDKRTCDDWIDECLSRFKCKKYVFVVDKTEKYAQYMADEIQNKFHFGNTAEHIIVIDR